MKICYNIQKAVIKINVGIIAEYNPFHLGHLYHLQQSKLITNSDNVIVVMSGNFTQRGLPTIFDKNIRVSNALKNGVDLVLELPVPFATSSAEYFARESVNILNSSNIVDYLSFGSENGDLSHLSRIASFFNNEKLHGNNKYSTLLNKYLNKGLSFPKARNLAYNDYFDCDDLVLNNPNNILGIEYLKALETFNSNIKPITIKRLLSNYHSNDIEGSITSATSIRNEIYNNNFNSVINCLPTSSISSIENIINNKNLPLYNNLSPILHYILCSTSKENLLNISNMKEPLLNRLIEVSNDNFNIDDLLFNLKAKNFNLTSLQRTLLHLILNIKKDEFTTSKYIRVLGFNRNKSFLLNDLINKSSLPVVTNLKNAHTILDSNAMDLLNKEIQSTDIYNLCKPNSTRKNFEYTSPLITF